jgi:hypothetical protein
VRCKESLILLRVLVTDRGLMCTVGLGKRMPQAVCDFVVLHGDAGRTDYGIDAGITLHRAANLSSGFI